MRRKSVGAFGLSTLLGVFAVAGVWAAPLRIMPVGDSITRGTYLGSEKLPNPLGGGWRKTLQDKLRAAGIAFEFVGELDYWAFGTNGVVDPAFSPRHHGLAGFSNEGILKGGAVPTPKEVLAAKGVGEIRVPGIVEALARNKPDVVLLMSGANGFGESARDRLVETICAHFDGELFVATITPQKPPRNGWDRVEPYNASLPALVERLRKAGHRIHRVDMYAALTPDDISKDGVHPNETGLSKIADAWFQSLVREQVVSQTRRRRILFNNDGTFVLGNGIHANRPLTSADVRAYVDLVTNTPVTTYLICMNSSMPYYPSRVERHIGDAEGSKHASHGGLPHKGEDCSEYGENVRRLAGEGSDVVSLVIGRCREVGLEAFTSMRVNDLHFTDRSVCNPSSQAEFWLDHPDYDVGNAGISGWHSAGAMNFEHQAVRDYKLTLLREAMARFDPDGHEMDLMRFPVYFPADKAESDCPLMTDFIRQSRAIVKQAGQRAGKERLFGIRVPASVDLCRRAGLDVQAWVREGLVDFTTVSAFFVDVPTLPVARFREELGDAGVPIYAGLDHGIAEPKGGWGTFRAAAANRWREGADGLYFFNFFYRSYDGEPQAKGLVRCGPSRALLCELSDARTLCGRNKIYNAGGAENAYGTVIPSDLPAKAQKGVVTFRLPMAEAGRVPREAVLFLRLADGGSDLRVTFNGDPCESSPANAGTYRLDEGCPKSQRVAAFAVKPDRILAGHNAVRVEDVGGKAFEVKRADCAVSYGPAEACGYY